MSTIIRGDGSYHFTIEVDGDDLVVHKAKTTWFGGPTDPDDHGTTASGINTIDHPHVIGCGLPMDLSIANSVQKHARIYHPTKGSPMPRIPWFTMITVTGPSATMDVQLIDIGPNKAAGSQADFDLTPAAFTALGGKADFHKNSGDMIVDYRIKGGKKFLGASQLSR